MREVINNMSNVRKKKGCFGSLYDSKNYWCRNCAVRKKCLKVVKKVREMRRIKSWIDEEVKKYGCNPF